MNEEASRSPIGDKVFRWISQQTNPSDLLLNKFILKVLGNLNLGRRDKLSDSDNHRQVLTRFESGRWVSDARFESGRRVSDSNCISSLHSQDIHFHWHHSRLENEMSQWWPVQTIVKQIFMPQFWRKATKLAALEIAMSRILGQIISREVLKTLGILGSWELSGHWPAVSGRNVF